MNTILISFRIPREIDELIRNRIDELRLYDKANYMRYLIVKDLSEAGYKDSLDLVKIVYRGDAGEV